MLRLVGHYHHPVISSTLSSLSRSSLPLTRLLTPPSLSSLVLHRNYKTSSKKKVISKKVVSKKDEKDKKKKKMDNKKKEKKTKEPTPPPAEATVESSNASSSTSTTSQSSIIMRKKVLDANGFPTQVYILPLFNDVAFPGLHSFSFLLHINDIRYHIILHYTLFYMSFFPFIILLLFLPSFICIKGCCTFFIILYNL